MSRFRFSPVSLNAIRRHARDRRNAAAIAKLMDCSEATVHNICRDHGIEIVTMEDGAPPPRPYRAADRRYVSIDIHVGHEAMELIRLEAARRGVKPAILIARVSEIIASESLFAAVLDT